MMTHVEEGDMSDTSQGSGWWVASDGKWYPPEQAPGAQPAPQPPPPQPGPPPSSGGKGCIYALIAVAVVVFVGIVGVVLAIAFFGGEAIDNIEDAADEDPCPFLTNGEVNDVLGDDTKAVELSGFNQLLTLTVDARVLQDAPDCVVLKNDAAVARVARSQGSDASSVFAAEKDIADGTSEDRGGGVSVETDDFISDRVVDMGDEAFCTTSSFLGGAGVLVRQGDTLVYVSIQLDAGETPEVDLDSGGFATDDEHCTQAQELAKKVLG